MPTNRTSIPTLSPRTSFWMLLTCALATLAGLPIQAVATTLAITTTTLPPAYVGSPYTATLAATGGTGSGYVWTISSGAPPSPITLSTAGVLSGKPSTAGVSSFTVTLKDSASNTATAILTLTVKPALTITTSALKTPYVGTKYSTQLLANGGSGNPHQWTITVGTLPAGLTLSSAGILSGIPSATGAASFTAKVTDGAHNLATANLSVIVGPQLILTSGLTLPVGYQGITYAKTLSATGGSASGYKWSVSPRPPQGISLSSSGILSGSPAVPGTTILNIKVTDSALNVATAAFTLVANPAISTCTNDHQSTALVELHGVYTFSLNRFNLVTNERFTSIGSFNADGLGNIRNGVMDSNGPTYPTEAQDTFTGTYTVGSDGRGRMSIAIPPTSVGGTTQNNSFCFALDSFTKTGQSVRGTIIEDDPSNQTASGAIYLQTANPTPLSVKGTWAFGMAGRKINPALNLPDFRHTAVGFLTLNGISTVTGKVDQNKDGVDAAGNFLNLYTAATGLTGTYTLPKPTVGTPTGRGTFHLSSGGSGSGSNFVFYPAGTSYMVLLQIDDANPTNVVAYAPVLSGGAFRRANSTFSNIFLTGSSVDSQYFLADAQTPTESTAFAIDVTVWNGKGTFTSTGDSSSKGVATTTSGSGTYTVDATGRFAVMVNGHCAPCGYLSGVNAGFALYDSTDQVLMRLQQQIVPIGGNFTLAGFTGGYSAGTRWYVDSKFQALSGEVISKGLGSISGTLDQNQQGDTIVDQAIADSIQATATSGVHGRFLLFPSNTSTPAAFYLIGPNEAISLPLGGTNNLSQPFTDYRHQ